jgi:hypothetical protein
VSRCARFDVYVVEIYYWSRSTPTYLYRDWRSGSAGPEVAMSDAAMFGTREEAESEALLFVAACARYAGAVKVKAMVSGEITTFRGKKS